MRTSLQQPLVLGEFAHQARRSAPRSAGRAGSIRERWGAVMAGSPHFYSSLDSGPRYLDEWLSRRIVNVILLKATDVDPSGPRLPLNALRVFEAVAAHLSFTAAARELGVTTAAVSAQIKSLEADIGVPLFRRHTRAVALTQEGAELLPGSAAARRTAARRRPHPPRARRRHAESQRTERFLQRWLLPRLGEFTRQHPEIEVRFGPPALPASTSVATISTPPSSTVPASGPASSRNACSTNRSFRSAAPPCSPSSARSRRFTDFARYPLIHSRTEPWQDWLRRSAAIRRVPTSARRWKIPRRPSPRSNRARASRSLAGRWSPPTSPPAAWYVPCSRVCSSATPGTWWRLRELLFAESRTIPRLAARLLPRVLPARWRNPAVLDVPVGSPPLDGQRRFASRHANPANVGRGKSTPWQACS